MSVIFGSSAFRLSTTAVSMSRALVLLLLVADFVAKAEWLSARMPNAGLWRFGLPATRLDWSGLQPMARQIAARGCWMRWPGLPAGSVALRLRASYGLDAARPSLAAPGVTLARSTW